MADPKPITVVYTDPNEYDGPEPQPFTIVGDSPFDPAAIAGYDEGETQTLKNVSGALTWVTDAA